MIKGLVFERFQSISGPCRVSLRDLTFLYGPNSAGKSSVVDALRFFKSVVSLEMKDLDLSSAPIRNGQRESLSVGLELVLDDSSRIDESDSRRKERYDDGIYDGDFDDKKFFDSLKNQLICLKITAGGSSADDDCLEIFIDNELFLKVSIQGTWFDPELKFISPGEAADYQDPVYGYVYINKKIKGFKWLDLWSSMNIGNREIDSAIYKFFETEDTEKIEVRGLSFHLLATDAFFGTRLFAPHASNEDHLAEWNRTVFANFFHEFYESFPEPEVEILAKQNKKWLEFISEDSTQRSASIRSSLWRWSDRLSLLLEGFLLRISAELDFTTVPGVRNIIDSSIPLQYGRGGSYLSENRPIELHESIPRYFYNHIERLLGYSYEQDKSSGIVDAALGRLMPSLGKYSLRPLISKTSRVESTWIFKQDERPIFTDESGYTVGEGYALFPYLAAESMLNTAINFKDIGSGVSFIFPILTAIDKTALTVVEQPELHLHPRAQCELGDVFLYGVNHGKKMVIESHSEHILLRISRRIRETSRESLIAPDLKLSPDQVIVHYFRPNGDGTTTVFPIRFDEQGEFLDLWPDGFFAERESEIFGE